MKISRLVLKNYQSHVDTEIDFDQGLNVILGASDTGKSSIIRAILSILFKEKFYMRNGCSNGYVEIKFSDGSVLRREKTVKKDGTISDNYVLNGVVFRKIGKQIPKQIIDTIKIHPIELNDGSMMNLNVQTQHGGKFLLSDNEYSSGFRARVTSLSGSETLDKASLSASTEYRSIKSLITQYTEKTIPALNEKIQRHSDLLDLNDKYKELKLKNDYVLSLNDKIQKIKNIKSKLDSIKIIKIDLVEPISKMKQVLNKLSTILLLRLLNSNNKKFEKIEKLPSLDTVDTHYMLMNKIKTLYTTCRQINKTAMQNMSYRSLYEGWKKQYDDLVADGTNCPLCEQPLRSKDGV